MAGTPLWRRAFDEAERRVGRPLEDVTGTREFADVLSATVRIQKAIYGAYEQRARSVLHALNLPALSDIRRLNRQITTLTGEVRRLATRVEDELEAREPRE